MGDIEDDAVGESAVGLDLPRVFVVPHAEALRVPGLVFTMRVPARDVDVVHAAIVERRALGVASFEGHMAGGQVADADNGEVADFTVLDELLNFFVIPGVAIEQVDGDKTVARFNFADELPFGFHVSGDGFSARTCLRLARAWRICC